MVLLEKTRQIIRNFTGRSSRSLKTRKMPMSTNSSLLTAFGKHAGSPGQQKASMQHSGGSCFKNLGSNLAVPCLIGDSPAVAFLQRTSAGSQDQATVKPWQNDYALPSPCGLHPCVL
ncbi:MAG: hypothetical protein ONB49_10815 [candidate division KSB1 bacterium]|nr:hypothetical protein [candidate division KSB1 bacterium]